MPITPPRLADRLLRFICAPHRLEEVQGDLHEEFAWQVHRVGVRRARWRYWWDVVGFMKPQVSWPRAGRRQRHKVDSTTYLATPAMVRNYLKIAFRNLINQRVYSLLNLAGLSLGLTCVVLITLYLKNELTFDAFHAKAARIYRLTNTTTNAAGTEIKYRTGNTGAIQGPAFAAAIPEIEAFTRMQGVFFNVRRGDEGFYQDAHYVDDNFFQTFSISLLEGRAHSALSSVNAVVLTETGAAKYFGTTRAVGQTLALEIGDKFEPFVVTGIARDPTT